MSEALEAPAPTGDSAGKADEERIAEILYNFDNPNYAMNEDRAWAKQAYYDRARAVIAALRQPPQPTGDVGELERRASKFSARWGNSNPSVATMMAAFAIEEVKSANSRSMMQTWQPIDTAPKDGRHVIVFNDLGNVHVAKFGVRYLGDAGQRTWVFDGKYIGGKVTHWMPLPAAPALTGAGEEGE